MILLDQKYYKNLARELNSKLYEKQELEGIIELETTMANNQTAEVIFAYSAVNVTLDRGFDDLCYLVIAMVGDKRHAVEFDQHRFLIHFDQ